MAVLRLAIGDSDQLGVVVTGDAGLGKTRLAREALASAAAEGCDVVWAAATRAAASIPFGALSMLLPDTARHDAGLVQVLRATADHVAERAGKRRVVIAVDDAHLLDDASAALVHLLVAQELAFVIVTVRTGEPAPDAISGLVKDERVRRISLAALDPSTVDSLIGEVLDRPVDGISRRDIRHLTDGNPLLLREILSAGLASGALRERDGMWHWRGWPAGQGTVFFTDLVAGRLDALPAAARAAVEVVACGEPLSVHLLEELVEPAGIEDAERAGLLTVEQCGARSVARLGHPLHGEVIRATLPARRARTVWAGLAEALAGTPMRRRDDALLAAVWQLRSGVVTHADVLLPAARQALARFALDLAERLARLAAQVQPGWEVDRLLATILGARGRHQEAAALASGPPEDRGAWAATRATILYWGLDQTDQAQKVLDGVATVGGAADAMRCWLHLFEGQCADALDTGLRALDAPGAETGDVVRAAAGASAAAALLGRFDRAAVIRARGLAALARSDAADVPWGAEQLDYATCLTLLAAGRLREAWSAADRGYRRAVEEHANLPAGCWLAFRGVAEKTQGRVGAATASLREAVVLLADDDPFLVRPACLSKLASAAALAGDHAAADWLAQADAERRGANKLFTAWMALDRAWIMAARGQLSDALAQAGAAADLARDTGQPTFEAVARYDIARLGGERLAVTRLAELAGDVEGALVPALATAAVALRDADGPALERAATTFDDLGLLLLAAEATAAAARAYQQGGRRTLAVAAHHRAAVLAGACEGARTPLLRPAAPGDLLTRREYEVVMLAAAGQRSREIANRLRLSIRTVDNYLGRAYAKLGITSRDDLATVFRRDA